MQLGAWPLAQSGLVLLGIPLKLAIEVPSELVGEEGSVLCPPRWEVYEELPVVVADSAVCLFRSLRWSRLPSLF